MWSEEDNVITRASYSNTGCSVLYKNHRKLSVAGLLQFMLGIIILSLGISISKFFISEGYIDVGDPVSETVFVDHKATNITVI